MYKWSWSVNQDGHHAHIFVLGNGLNGGGKSQLIIRKVKPIDSLPLIQEGQLSVSGERMCTILVNRLED